MALEAFSARSDGSIGFGSEVRQEIHGGGGNVWQKKLLASW